MRRNVAQANHMCTLKGVVKLRGETSKNVKLCLSLKLKNNMAQTFALIRPSAA